jgi:hypothetical protein
VETKTEGDRYDRRTEPRDEDLPPDMDVRDDDMEPHAGLRYIARLFKILAILLILLLIGEVIIGLVREGNTAIPTLLVEATRIIVFAGLLWGAADMALMLIESNHDLRATRILVGRLNGKVSRLESASLGRPPGRPGTGPAPGAPPPFPPSGGRPPSHEEKL